MTPNGRNALAGQLNLALPLLPSTLRTCSQELATQQEFVNSTLLTLVFGPSSTHGVGIMANSFLTLGSFFYLTTEMLLAERKKS